MKLEDLGIDSKTGHHNKVLTHTENCFLGLLWIDHVGKDNKISADELAILFSAALEGRTIMPKDAPVLVKGYKMHAAKQLALLKRDVRRMQNHLLTQHENVPVLSKAGNGGGYWIADSEEEAEKFYDSFRQRGLTGLVKASRGKKAIMVEMMTQLSFEFEDLAVNIGMLDKTDMSGDPAAIAVVDSFLGRMLEDPEKFSTGLKKLSKKYGSVLLDKTEVAAMKEKAFELSSLVNSLGI